MHVVLTDRHNQLIACIDTTGGTSILPAGTKYFIAPQSDNIVFVEDAHGILAYPQIRIGG